MLAARIQQLFGFGPFGCAQWLTTAAFLCPKSGMATRHWIFLLSLALPFRCWLMFGTS